MSSFSPLSLVLVGFNSLFAGALLWHLRRGVEPESRNSAVILVIAYSVSAAVSPFALLGTGCTPAGEDLLFLIGALFLGGELAGLGIIVARNHRICARDPQMRQDRNYADFLKALPTEDAMRRDNSRKILHFVISVSPIIVYVSSFAGDAYFKSQGILQELGVSGLGAGRGINLLVYWGFSYMITMEDLFRFNGFHCLPGWGRLWLRTSLEAKEHHCFVAAVPFLLGHVPLLLAPFPVFFSVTFVASLGDAAGSIVGKRYGKHRIPRSKHKTFEGLAGGVLVSFACVLAVNLVLDSARWALALTFAAILAGIYGAFDALVTRVDDNFLNTFALGALAWGFYVVLSGVL